LEIVFFAVSALHKGFLLRDAIVCDKLYHTETKIFDPALVKAYQMEKKLAVYPRIILDDNILAITKEYPKKIPFGKENSKVESNTIQNMVLTDFDGYSFVNYLDIRKPAFWALI
jgi:hypothetical protein